MGIREEIIVLIGSKCWTRAQVHNLVGIAIRIFVQYVFAYYNLVRFKVD